MRIKSYFSKLYFTLRVHRRSFKLWFNEYSIFKPKRRINIRTVVAMLDFKSQRIGLSDRLRGAIFIYNSIKELQEEGLEVEFKIDFSTPFELSQYLVPATYDWQISPDEISYNSLQVEVIKFGTRGDSQEHRDYLKRRIKKGRCNQIHVYCNRFDNRKGNFSTPFNELFKPSKRLQDVLNPHFKALHTGDGGYLNTTLRFQNLLGDFHEGEKRMPLEEQQQIELKERCLAQIERIHEENPGKMILVTSDSRTFLQAAKEREYVYTVDGELVHMAFTSDNSFEAHQKAFIDYLMIAGAERIYLLRTGKMFKSGFPRTASMINNRPFEHIEF